MLPKQTVRDALKDSDKQSGLACKTMNNEMEGGRSSDNLSLIHISEPTRLWSGSRMPSSA